MLKTVEENQVLDVPSMEKMSTKTPQVIQDDGFVASEQIGPDKDVQVVHVENCTTSGMIFLRKVVEEEGSQLPIGEAGELDKNCPKLLQSERVVW
jgi:hypothetical protein